MGRTRRVARALLVLVRRTETAHGALRDVPLGDDDRRRVATAIPMGMLPLFRIGARDADTDDGTNGSAGVATRVAALVVGIDVARYRGFSTGEAEETEAPATSPPATRLPTPLLHPLTDTDAARPPRRPEVTVPGAPLRLAPEVGSAVEVALDVDGDDGVRIPR